VARTTFGFFLPRIIDPAGGPDAFGTLFPAQSIRERELFRHHYSQPTRRVPRPRVLRVGPDFITMSAPSTRVDCGCLTTKAREEEAEHVHYRSRLSPELSGRVARTPSWFVLPRTIDLRTQTVSLEQLTTNAEGAQPSVCEGGSWVFPS